MSHFVSVRDLIQQVTDRVPNGTNIPSESTVLLAFVPRDSHKNVSKLYKSRIPLQFKVQSRQSRSNHQDDHYCAAIFKYLRQYAVKYRDSLSFYQYLFFLKRNRPVPVIVPDDTKCLLDFVTTHDVRKESGILPTNSFLCGTTG